MIKQARTTINIVFLVGLILLMQVFLRKNFSYDYPFFGAMINPVIGEKTAYRLVDLGGIVFGMRRMVANIAWIQLLQYYGTPELDEEGKEIHQHGLEYGSGKYYSLLSLSQRVVRLDPYFHYAYLYGAGALAWNLDRPEEAIVLLKEGLRNDPKYWRFGLYLGAVVYKQLNKFDKMIVLLEEVVKYPDCPAMMKVILANIYEKQNRYLDCLNIWLGVYESKDESYRFLAEKKIFELRHKLPQKKIG